MNALGKPVVLVVDDEDALRALLRLALQQHGFEVLTAASGPEGLAAYASAPRVDVVLLDVTLPGMDGLATLRRLRGLDPHVVCCFMSGKSAEYLPQELLAAGAADILPKPFGLAALVKLLHRLARGR